MLARCAALRAACSFRKKINSSSSKFEAQITSVPLITNRLVVLHSERHHNSILPNNSCESTEAVTIFFISIKPEILRLAQFANVVHRQISIPEAKPHAKDSVEPSLNSLTFINLTQFVGRPDLRTYSKRGQIYWTYKVINDPKDNSYLDILIVKPRAEFAIRQIAFSRIL
ncbi:hypothetical protein J6590_015783 [Homalodisca vitripennis]|nr:hypothetical protein J6590_015783 [Homalodisca vitripennis]